MTPGSAEKAKNISSVRRLVRTESQSVPVERRQHRGVSRMSVTLGVWLLGALCGGGAMYAVLSMTLCR